MNASGNLSPVQSARRKFAPGSALLGALSMAIAPVNTMAFPSQPNIVVMMTDNQGYGDLGAYGGLRAETPRLDAMAGEGMQFMDFQVEPGCTATRAAFMTGRMPIRSGTSGYVERGQPGGLDPREVTLAELLKGAGYSTAMYGKWHLGKTHERRPYMQGFDEWYGITNTTVPIDPSLPGVDASGGVALLQPMMQAITPVLRSFQRYPNRDYSMMKNSN